MKVEILRIFVRVVVEDENFVGLCQGELG